MNIREILGKLSDEQVLALAIALNAIEIEDIGDNIAYGQYSEEEISDALETLRIDPNEL